MYFSRLSSMLYSQTKIQLESNAQRKDYWKLMIEADPPVQLEKLKEVQNGKIVGPHLLNMFTTN